MGSTDEVRISFRTGPALACKLPSAVPHIDADAAICRFSKRHQRLLFLGAARPQKYRLRPIELDYHGAVAPVLMLGRARRAWTRALLACARNAVTLPGRRRRDQKRGLTLVASMTGSPRQLLHR